jgi:hypothetical protein
MKTREEVRAKMRLIFQDCENVFSVANQEYATSQNAFNNFDRDAIEVGIHRNQSWLILAGKHWRGIASYVRGLKGQREDIRHRIKDLIIYLVLFWAMLDDEEEENKLTQAVPQLRATPLGICGEVRAVSPTGRTQDAERQVCTMEPGHKEDHFQTSDTVR